MVWTRKGDRAAKRRKVIAHEIQQKAIVRERDDYRCRVPGCMNPRRQIEVAHLEDKGMGGDPQGIRTVARKMLVLCRDHHQGRRSVHSGHLVITPQDAELGTDGPCSFDWRR